MDISNSKDDQTKQLKAFDDTKFGVKGLLDVAAVRVVDILQIFIRPPEKSLKILNLQEKLYDIYDNDGNRMEGNLMEQQFVNHFRKFLGANKVIKVTDTEIKNAIFDIGDSKAPGPDGYTSTFFKKAWKIVGKDVCLAIKEFFNTEKLLGEVNATLISLVPKISTLNKGERKGYFQSGKGLRQGGLMSPCLFTLVIKVFTLLMAKNVQQNPRDVEYVQIIKQSMMEFSEISGLIPNLEKSTVFFSNVKQSMKVGILDILPFVVRKLPLKYLEVPLITKRLTSKECKKLIDKVKARVEEWKNKYLSYASRLQLIASVLSSLNVRLKEGKQKWHGKLCSPKSQGGLGLGSFVLWNEVLLIKNLWNIIAGENTLWVKWVNVFKLKGRNIWEIQIESNDSWLWKTLLDLKEKITLNVREVLGNGKNTNMWFYYWSSVGILSDNINSRDIYDARLNSNLCVYDMIKDNKWIWSKEWAAQFPSIDNINLGYSGGSNGKQEVKDKKIVLNLIVESVKLQLSCLKVKKSCNVDRVASRWNVRMGVWLEVFLSHIMLSYAKPWSALYSNHYSGLIIISWSFPRYLLLCDSFDVLDWPWEGLGEDVAALALLIVVYVLPTPMPELLEDDTLEANVESAKELWDSLESMYMAEDASSKKFLVSNFNNYKMVNSRPIMEQLNELLRIHGQYTLHGLKMDESICVSSVIDKWPSSLRILNMRAERIKTTNKNKGKKRGLNDNNVGSGSNKKPKVACWKCDETGHFKNHSHSRNKKDNTSASGSGEGSKEHSQNQGQKLMLFRGGLIPVSQLMFVKIVAGSVVLEFSSGNSITLFNVLYVPKPRKNGMFMLNLNKPGVFIRFGYYNNGIFMLHLNKVPGDSGSVYMCSSTVVNSSLWHASLGHVHYKRMLEMSKYD
ncbi:hypothetical protein Tco_0789131 [Tanacetum coccineum]